MGLDYNTKKLTMITEYTTKEIIYNAILNNTRVAAYKINSEYWYVIEWGKKCYLHYTQKQKPTKMEFYYFLADSTLWPQWKCQTDLITIDCR